MAPAARDRGREVRGQLLRAAGELIAEKGWRGVSTRLVAERAGVTAGLVHYHFASLEALLAESAVGTLREAVSAVTAVLQRCQTPAEAVDTMLKAVDQYTGTDPASLLVCETYLAATRNDDLREQVSDVVGRFRADLGQWLAGHEVADNAATAAVLAATIDGVLLHRALNPDMTSALAAPVVRRLVAEHEKA